MGMFVGILLGQGLSFLWLGHVIADVLNRLQADNYIRRYPHDGYD